MTNIKVGLHALCDGLGQILPFHLDHYRKRKPLKQRQLLSVVVAMVVDGDPDVHGVVRVLAVYLVEI